MQKQLTEKFNNRLNLLLVVSVLLILIDVFTLTEERIANLDSASSIFVPYIMVADSVSLVIWFALFLMTASLALIKKDFKIPKDPMLIFLLFRVGTAIFQIAFLSFVGNSIIRYGNYFLWIIELLIYLSFKLNTQSGFIYLYTKFIKVIVVLISIETIYQSVAGVLPRVAYVSTWYKAWINIPFGSSNFIAVVIAPCFVAMLFSQKKMKVLNIMVLLVQACAVFLTKSRWGIGIVFLSVLIFIFKRKGSRKTLIFNMIITLGCVLIVGVYLKEHWDEIKIVGMGYSDYVTTGGVMNKITSGRLQLIEEDLNKFISYPIIGYGPNYADTRSHNILIDLLYQNGIVGIALFVNIIISIWNKRKICMETFVFKFIFIYCLVQVIGALGEISFFTNRGYDLLFLPMVAFLNNVKNVEDLAIDGYYETS